MAKTLSVIAPFICPLMMVFMIPMMFKGNKDKRDKIDHQNRSLQIDEKTHEE